MLEIALLVARPLRITTALLIVVVTSTACLFDLDGEVLCARPGIPIIVAEVRDHEGRPAANGATLHVQDDEIFARGEGFGEYPYVSSEGHDNRPGTYRVAVTKPWHLPAVIDGVRALGDECGLVESTRVQFTLIPVPWRPPIRQVVLPPTSYGYGGYYVEAIPVFVEADSSVTLVWTSTDTTAARVDQSGIITTVCVDATAHTWIVAHAEAAPWVRDSLSVTVIPPSPQHADRCP